MFGHDICLKGRLYTFLTFSAFKIHNSVSLWVKITRKPNSIGRPSLCLARKQSSKSATGCDVINRWIIGTRNFAKSWAPPCTNPTRYSFVTLGSTTKLGLGLPNKVMSTCELSKLGLDETKKKYSEREFSFEVLFIEFGERFVS